MSEETSELAIHLDSIGVNVVLHEIHITVYELCKSSNIVSAGEYRHIREEVHSNLWNIVNRDIFYIVSDKVRLCLTSETK